MPPVQDNDRLSNLLAAVPIGARRILDIGCGAGDFGAALKRRQPCHVTGIEADPAQSNAASKKLDDVLVGDAVSRLQLLSDGYFEAVVLGDILPKVVDHDGLLRAARRKLAASGRLILSVPNVGHWSVLRDLIQGRWTYQDEGILDRRHLRFFTRRSILGTLMEAGYAVDTLAFVTTPAAAPPAALIDALSPFGMDVSSLAAEAQVHHYVVVARPVG